MRIIAGDLRNRPIRPPPEHAMTRPIPARVKKSMFDTLRGIFDGGGVVLDLFAGTGSIGLEAISRGATRCVFFEQDKKVAQILETNARDLGVLGRVDVVTGDALGPAVFVRCADPIRAVFLDPPYPLVQSRVGWDRVRAQIERLVQRLEPDGFVVLRTPHPFVVSDVEVPTTQRRGNPRAHPHESRNHSRAKNAMPSKRELERMLEREIEHGLLCGEEIDPETGEPIDEMQPVSPHRKRRRGPEDAGIEHVPTDTASEMADLTIHGARGPETHAIRQTAFHLYMCERTRGSSNG